MNTQRYTKLNFAASLQHALRLFLAKCSHSFTTWLCYWEIVWNYPGLDLLKKLSQCSDTLKESAMIVGNSHWNLIQIFAASPAMSRNASNVTTYNALRHSLSRSAYICVTLFLSSSHALGCSPDVICPDVISYPARCRWSFSFILGYLHWSYDTYPTFREHRNIL